MSIKLRWLGYVCFEVVLPDGKVLVIDPYIDYSPTSPIRCQDVTGADYIAITHGHFDHITDIGTLVEKFNSKVICSHQLAEPLTALFAFDFANVVKVTSGDDIVFGDLRIEVKRGQHVNILAAMRAGYERSSGREATGMSGDEVLAAAQSVAAQSQTPETRDMMQRIRDARLGTGEQLNFVFQTSENLRIYVYSSGIYEHLRQEVVDAHCNVFLPQLGGIGPRQVAEVSALSGAEIVIPTHHDGGGAKAMHRAVQRMAKHLAARTKAQVLDIEPGKWYEIGVTASPV